MLELRPCCENCERDLPNESSEAMICTYECTFCRDCVENVLENVCPNCGGGFEKRPTRPHNGLIQYPMRTDKVINPVLDNKYLKSNKNIDPRMR